MADEGDRKEAEELTEAHCRRMDERTENINSIRQLYHRMKNLNPLELNRGGKELNSAGKNEW